MRREEYERSYGRRGHMPPMMPSPQEDPRSRRSRTKMKCLISIGLILPALAAVIGVAAWAVSADVVMSSGNGRSSKPENTLMQNYVMDSDNRRDIFRDNQIRAEARSTDPSSTPSTTTTKRTTTTSTTTTTTTTPAPVTLSPQEETDVNAILSKLISASGAAAGGGSGPRFVVVAPLPDNPEQPPAISRADPSTIPSAKEDTWHAKRSEPEPDLFASSSNKVQGRAVPNHHHNNASSTRRMSSKPYMVGIPSNNGFNNPQIDLTGFEPFDTMMLEASQSNPKLHQNPPPPHWQKRGPPQGHTPRNQHDQHIFHHIPDHAIKASHPHSIIAHPPPGMKPIQQQQQLHHMDPLRPEESNRWGAVGFHGPPGGGYVHKPPEGISLSISSPANSGTHVSSEPVSVIKSFFLPFLPKPRLNMNARVVFGVVLDKGLGVGGDKKSVGRPPFH